MTMIVGAVVNIERYRDLINRALEYSGGTHLFEDVAQMVHSGNLTLWPERNSVAVTEFLVYPRKKVLHVFLAAGDRDELTGLIDAAAVYGRSHGCTEISMSGRAGWQRVLSKHGFDNAHTTMKRTI